MRIDNITLDVEPGDRVTVDANPDLGLVKLGVHPLRHGEGLSLWMTVDAARSLRDNLADALALRAVQ